MTRHQLSVCAMLALALPLSAQRAPSPLAGFDAYVTKAMADWKVPGVAITVVRNDSVILSRGYGVRRLGEDSPVDAQTLFAIGSSSKAFTAAALAMLVDEGKVRWDDPVSKYLPGFQLHDPYATRELTVRDVLSHRSGLSRGDLTWYGSAHSRAEILQRVRHLRPTSSFRSQFGYQNLMFLAAGEIVGGVSGKSWDDFLRDRIFTPLGMSSSSTSIRALEGRNNVASPHTEVADTVRAVPYRNIDNIGPAGSINSNVADMAQWVRFQLSKGKAGQKQLIAAGAFGEMWEPNTLIRISPPSKQINPYTHLMSYGMGWFLEDYRGRLMVQHGGNIDGMSALVAMVPEEKLGVVVLTNMNGSQLPTILMRRLVDGHLGVAAKDWSADTRKLFDVLMKGAEEAEAKEEKSRVEGTKPSLALQQYAGTYADSLFGEAVVTASNGKLQLRFGPAFEGELEHWHYDTFRSTWKDRALGKSPVTFNLGPDGKVASLRTSLGEAIEFTKVPIKADSTKMGDGR